MTAHRSVHGELAGLGVKIAASTVWEILKTNGIDPALRRAGPTWSQFLRSQAEAILACDLFIVDLLDGTQSYVLAVIEHASRRIRILGVTPHPTGEQTVQQARNLIMDLGEQTHRVKFMIRDRGPDFTAAFDAVLADAGIRTVLCNVRTPRMNAIAERWTGGCRRELLDRTLAWNQAHLRRTLSHYESHHNQHRPHRSLDGAAPLKPATRTDRSRAVPDPKTGSRRWPDQRIPPGRMTWMSFSAPTGNPLRAQPGGRPAPIRRQPAPRRIPARTAQRPGRRLPGPRTRGRAALAASFDRSRLAVRSVSPVWARPDRCAMPTPESGPGISSVALVWAAGSAPTPAGSRTAARRR